MTHTNERKNQKCCVLFLIAARDQLKAIWIWVRSWSAMAVFSGLLVIVAFLQFWTFMQSERSFVFPADTDFTGPLVAEKQPLTLYLDIANSGKSPATIKELVAFVTHNLPTTPYYGDRQAGIRVAVTPVPAQGKIRQILPFGPPWGVETTRDVKSGKMGFYLYGRIVYDDRFAIFGPNESRFCFAYDANQNPEKAVFRTCHELAYTGTQ